MNRVLIVDDDPQIVWLTAGMVSALGFDVVQADRAAAAVELLAIHPFGFVITDLDMPEHDGLWLLEEVRSRQPETIRVLCSGRAVPGDGLCFGLVHRFLRKPFTATELAVALRPPTVRVLVWLDLRHGCNPTIALAACDGSGFVGSAVTAAQRALECGVRAGGGDLYVDGGDPFIDSPRDFDAALVAVIEALVLDGSIPRIEHASPSARADVRARR